MKQKTHSVTDTNNPSEPNVKLIICLDFFNPMFCVCKNVVIETDAKPLLLLKTSNNETLL